MEDLEVMNGFSRFWFTVIVVFFTYCCLVSELDLLIE